MRAEVKHIVSPDVDMESTDIGDPSDFCILVQMIVSPIGGADGDSFDVLVCTPAWMSRRLVEGGPIIGRHYLVVETFEPNGIKHFLRRQVESVEAPSWLELATKIGRIGKWEFEDYSQ